MRNQIIEQNDLHFIQKLIYNGGPNPQEYTLLDNWLNKIIDDISNNKIEENEIKKYYELLGDSMSLSTMQGFSYLKPHGYAGDFEIIDRIYKQHTSEKKHLKKWDHYFHSRKAPIAVRNRKTYCKNLLASLVKCSISQQTVSVLNVASGPCRDIFEFLNESEAKNISIDCIEYDQAVINFAQDLCKAYLDQINFYKKNALRFKPKKQYKLIWSAGLFDYLNDKQFKFLLTHLYRYLDEQSELVIGNFSTDNPSRAYMEVVGQWFLNHRSQDELIQLAKECGISINDIKVGYEPEKVNLFLHIKKGERFIPMKEMGISSSNYEFYNVN